MYVSDSWSPGILRHFYSKYKGLVALVIDELGSLGSQECRLWFLAN